MKMKYIIIPTIVFNLVCLSIFISRQYKKYHTRKSNYIHYIETIKAKIIKTERDEKNEKKRIGDRCCRKARKLCFRLS